MSYLKQYLLLTLLMLGLSLSAVFGQKGFPSSIGYTLKDGSGGTLNFHLEIIQEGATWKPTRVNKDFSRLANNYYFKSLDEASRIVLNVTDQYKPSTESLRKYKLGLWKEYINIDRPGILRLVDDKGLFKDGYFKTGVPTRDIQLRVLGQGSGVLTFKLGIGSGKDQFKIATTKEIKLPYTIYVESISRDRIIDLASKNIPPKTLYNEYKAYLKNFKVFENDKGYKSMMRLKVALVQSVFNEALNAGSLYPLLRFAENYPDEMTKQAEDAIADKETEYWNRIVNTKRCEDYKNYQENFAGLAQYAPNYKQAGDIYRSFKQMELDWESVVKKIVRETEKTKQRALLNGFKTRLSTCPCTSLSLNGKVRKMERKINRIEGGGGNTLSPCEQAFEEAELENTIAAYEAFLEKCAEDELADSAQSLLDLLMPIDTSGITRTGVYSFECPLKYAVWPLKVTMIQQEGGAPQYLWKGAGNVLMDDTLKLDTMYTWDGGQLKSNGSSLSFVLDTRSIYHVDVEDARGFKTRLKLAADIDPITVQLLSGKNDESGLVKFKITGGKAPFFIKIHEEGRHVISFELDAQEDSIYSVNVQELANQLTTSGTYDLFITDIRKQEVAQLTRDFFLKPQGAFPMWPIYLALLVPLIAFLYFRNRKVLQTRQSR